MTRQEEIEILAEIDACQPKLKMTITRQRPVQPAPIATSFPYAAVPAGVTPEPAPRIERLDFGLYRVESKSSPGEWRIVKALADTLSCDCPAGTHARRCWHKDAVAPMWAAECEDLSQPDLDGDDWEARAAQVVVTPEHRASLDRQEREFYAGMAVTWLRTFRHKPAEPTDATVVRVDGDYVVVRARDGARGPVVDFLVKHEAISPRPAQAA